MYIHIWVYLVISLSFEETLYKAHEHNGSIAPKLTLSRPSSCDFIIHAQLVPLGKLIDICMHVICNYNICRVYIQGVVEYKNLMFLIIITLLLQIVLCYVRMIICNYDHVVF